MLRALFGFLSLMCLGFLTPAFAADEPPKVLVDDARVLATNLGTADAAKLPTDLDRVVIDLSGGQATFVAKGAALKSAAARMIVLQIKDVNTPPLANTTGLPEAFPRPNVKKILENDRVAIWDYTWSREAPPPVHFHAKHALVTYLGQGVMRSTGLKGEVSENNITYGLVNSNASGRAHTEALVSGDVRAVIVELK